MGELPSLGGVRSSGRAARRLRFGALLSLALAALLLPARPSAGARDPSAEGASCEVPPAPAGEPGGPAPTAAAAALERGNAHAARGDYAAALPDYSESRRLAEAAGEARIATLAAANAARAALETGRFAGVEAELRQAAVAGGDLPDPAARAQLLLHVGRSQALLAERRPAARAAAAAAAETFVRAEAAARQAGDERLRAYALGYLGNLYERADRRDEALELTRRALYAAQLADAADALALQQWQLGRLEVAAGHEAVGLASYRDAVATLRELRSQAAGSLQSSPDAIYEEFVELLLDRAGRTDDPTAKQALLVEARDALEDRKTAELRDYFHDPCLDAQRKATPDTIAGTVVVYPVLLHDRTELIVSRAGRLDSFRVPVGRDALVAEVREFRRALERRTTREYLAPARTLYDWLIRPIEPFLAATTGPTTLVFVPDGALRTIPFAALRDGETRQFLIEKFPIAVTPSLTLTDPRPIDIGRVRLLAAGISEAVGGYPELRSVETEIDTIRELYPGETLLNGGFRVEQFRKELQNVPFGIVHIASHGEFGEDSADNYLLAYDGHVSMEQLAAFVGATRFRAEEPLELLTLSACESAAGDDRAALGLAGVALRAGARSALATLWSVNDRATADLVIEFYEQLRDPEHSRAEALQNAQVKMLRTRHYRHPSYWAPFLLISSWL